MSSKTNICFGAIFFGLYSCFFFLISSPKFNLIPGLTATITPSLNTSKVLVLVQQTVQTDRASSTSASMAIKLLRGATTIDSPFYGTGGSYSVYAASLSTTVSIENILPMMYLDSPATTSATTYKTQGQLGSTANSAVSDWNYGSGATITLLEIGA